MHVYKLTLALLFSGLAALFVETSYAQTPVDGRIRINDKDKQRPKYGGDVTEGTSVSFKTTAIASDWKYVILVPEIKMMGETQFREVGCRTTVGKQIDAYGYRYPNRYVIARDISATGSRVNHFLFVPDEVLDVSEGSGDIRYKIEFLDDNGDTVRAARLGSVPVSIGQSNGRFSFYRAVNPDRKTKGETPSFEDR